MRHLTIPVESRSYATIQIRLEQELSGRNVARLLKQAYRPSANLSPDGRCSIAGLGVYGVAVLRSPQVSREMKGASTIAPVI